MLIACTLAFFCPLPSTPGNGVPLEPAPVLAPALEPPLIEALVQGTVVPAQPRGFISIGAHYVDGDFESPLGNSPDAGEGFGFDAGLYTWNGELGLAAEIGMLVSSQSVKVSSLSDEDVDTTRYMLGLRVADAGEDSAFLTYLRAGYMMRQDKSDSIDESGSGWYAGGGFEWKFAGPMSLGPQVLYADSSSASATEWLYGVTLTLSL